MTSIAEGGRRPLLTGMARKMWAVSRLSFWNAATQSLGQLSGSFFLFVVMFVFVQLWQGVYSAAGEGLLAGFSLQQMIWYLAVAQVVGGSLTKVASDLDRELKEGTFTYRLLRPLSYIWFHLAYYLGERLPLAAANGLVTMGVAAWATGAPPISATGAAAFLLTWLLGAVLNYFLVIAIGLTGLWVEDTRPYIFIYSRLLMILGGMVIPLDLFPAGVQAVVSQLPLHLIVYGPARLLVRYDPARFVSLVLYQVGWIAVAVLVSLLIYRRGVKRLHVHGG